MMATKGRVALLTGATSGIGEWTALGLVRTGYRVIAVARDPIRAERLFQWVRGQCPSAQLELVRYDLSSMAEVTRLVADVRQKADRLDLLVNNAGLLRDKRVETVDGHEMTLAVNHLAPFLLTRGLLPLLQATSHARIVNVGSSSSDKAGIELDDLEWLSRRWSTFAAYGQSKLALMIASFEFARRLGSSPTINVVHPGSVGTRIGDLGGLGGFAWKLMKPLLMTPQTGARTTLYVAADNSLAEVTGRYFKRSAPASPNPLASDQRLASALWSRTETLLGLEPTCARWPDSPSRAIREASC